MAARTAIVISLSLGLAVGCAQSHPPASPHAHAPESGGESAPKKAEKAPLGVESGPVATLNSSYFTVFEFTFANSTNEWQHVKRVELAADRRMKGPKFEVIVGERLRTWQLAARESLVGKPEAGHIALSKWEAKEAPKPPAVEAPPEHLLSLPFSVAPGLVRRKWAVLYTPKEKALAGQDLVLEYELEDGKVQKMLVQQPAPEQDD